MLTLACQKSFAGNDENLSKRDKNTKAPGTHRRPTTTGAIARLKTWYDEHLPWFGWLGVALVGLTFVSKEVLPKSYQAETSEIDKSLTALENDEREQRQIENTRVYGVERPDLLESMMIRLEETLKLDANDGYYMGRIERLNDIDAKAHSGFLDSRHMDAERLKMAPKGIYNSSLATIANLGQVRKANQTSEKKLFGIALSAYTKEQTDEAEKVFRTEDTLHKYLDEWNASQRKALETRRASIETRSHGVEIITYIVFAIGWLITIVDKLLGKPGHESPLGKVD